MEATQYRTKLPAKTPKNDLSIWSVLKSCVGKDLSKITMPVQFNEPLSFLQRIAETLEYSHLLDIESKDELERIQIVSGFAISNLASNCNRLGKPFNPLFGETFELERDGFKFICEQVSHHPPISAFHAESDKFVFHGWIYPKIKLWGKSVEVHPKGKLVLHLKRFNETYTWNNVNCSIHNVIVGKLWIEHHGSMEVSCAETGLKITLQFKPTGWFHNELHRVEGFLVDRNKKKLRYLYGKWTESLRSTDMDSYEEYMKSNAHNFKLLGEPSADPNKKSPSVSPKPPRKIFQKFNSLSIRSFSTSSEPPTGEDLSPENQDDSIPKSDGVVIDIPNSNTLWEVIPKPEDTAEYYYFTLFAMSLNQVLPNQLITCPTDSRHRPDVRRLEDGDLEAASVEKQRLEDIQRKFLKTKPDMTPNWFERQGDDWNFKGTYWTTPDKSHIVRMF